MHCADLTQVLSEYRLSYNAIRHLYDKVVPILVFGHGHLADSMQFALQAITIDKCYALD